MKSNRLILFASVMPLILLTLNQTACEPEQPSMVEGFTFVDTNQNGKDDPGEPVLPDIDVRLFDGSGKLIETTTTDEYGHYSFPDLPSGSYSIQIILPENYKVSVQPVSIPVDPATGKSGIFQIHNQTITVDIGLALRSDNGGPGVGDTLPVQNTISITPSEDTSVSQYSPTNNYGNQDRLPLQNDSMVFMRFPLDQLPKNSTLISAVLDMFIRASSNSRDALAAITFPDPATYWLEGALTWENKPAQAPNAVTIYSQLADNSGEGSKDSFDVQEPLMAYLQTHPDAEYFDITLSYSRGEYIAQDYYSRESLLPPLLNVSYSSYP